MLNRSYRFFREGRWRLWVQEGKWSPGLWAEVQRQLASHRASRHPQTSRFSYAAGDRGEEFYLKAYHRSYLLGSGKDIFRQSKALRALKQGILLAGHGFHAPVAVAAGEERSLRVLTRAFLLTAPVEGLPLPLFLQNYCAVPLTGATVRQKRDYLRQLALEIRRLHRAGFVHGDLVPSNIFLRRQGTEVTFFYMDNDRTRLYPAWLPQSLWKRNLVQLNRFVLPGISLQDRMRFLRCYLGKTPWGRSERNLARWLEKKTRRRRLECDRIAARVSFRELMRWNGPFTRNMC